MELKVLRKYDVCLFLRQITTIPVWRMALDIIVFPHLVVINLGKDSTQIISNVVINLFYLSSADIVYDRPGAVRLRGLYNSRCPKRLDNVWSAWSFQCNLTFESVH